MTIDTAIRTLASLRTDNTKTVLALVGLRESLTRGEERDLVLDDLKEATLALERVTLILNSVIYKLGGRP